MKVAARKITLHDHGEHNDEGQWESGWNEDVCYENRVYVFTPYELSQFLDQNIDKVFHHNYTKVYGEPTSE